jgi:integrase/recombinase XerD
LEKTTPRTIYLTVEEIQLLFKTTYEPVEINPTFKDIELAQRKNQHFAARDRAMLAVYYGCGLRRNEGISLMVSDINFDKAILHVRKGKKNKQRFVPVSKASLKYLQEYIYDHRGELF